jgi:DNA repair protein RecO (recombination protein O)
MSLMPFDQAFVLHRRPYSNTSWIIEFFTENHGRVVALARSARGLKSRYRGQLEPFVPMQITWRGRMELKNLANLELTCFSWALSGQALLCAFYVNELILRLLHREDPHPLIFQQYTAVLAALHEITQGEDLDIPLRRFERILLQELGYGLSLTHESQTKRPVEPQAFYHYLPQEGLVRVPVPLAGQSIRGASLLDFAADNWSNRDMRKEIKGLMRAVIAAHLPNQRLHSRELWVS